MAEQKQKVSDLPEQEQKELIAKAYAAGLKGFNFASYKVETLKEKIAEAEKNKKGESEGSKDEQIGSENEQTDGNGEQTDGNGEQNDSSTENGNDGDSVNESQEKETIVAGDGGVFEIENDTEKGEDDKILEGVSDETKDFLNGKTENPPEDAEEITIQESEKLQEKAKTDKLIPGERVSQKKETKKNEGICHICRSRVENGVCTGCGFSKK